MNILDVIERETGADFAKRGREQHGQCPFCRCAGKQFIVWPTEGRYLCRQCGHKGDSIQFLRDFKHLSFGEAKEYLGQPWQPSESAARSTVDVQPLPALHPPSVDWAAQAAPFVAESQPVLWADAGAKVRAWLHGRGLTDETIHLAGLGYNPVERYAERTLWGLPPEIGDNGRPKRVWLPRGVVIPWMIGGELWGVNFRRPVINPDERRYHWIPGGQANGLYGADALTPGKPAMILEGEFDQLIVRQQAGDLITPVATGSTHKARRTKWLARLSLSPVVLVAYDSDDAGNGASAYWVGALANAKRWRPYWKDANDLAQDGVDLRPWVLAGIGADLAPIEELPPPPDLSSYVGQVVSGDLWQQLQVMAWEGWKFVGRQVDAGWQVERYQAVGYVD